MRERRRKTGRGLAASLALVLMGAAALMATGCARLPYTTKTVHEDQRVIVTVQQEVDAQAHTHPVQLSSEDIASILRGFSVREQQRLPLRWFAEEAPPKPVFREDELQAVSPHLSATMKQLGANERAHFEVRGPGFNPAESRDVIAGWMAVQEPYLYLTLEQFHRQVPIRKDDLYDINYPATPPPPRNYILYFEPGRFWLEDQKGARAVQYRQFLNSGEAGGTGLKSIPAPVAP
ncbi:MAG: hypothetical protein GDA65_07940 [Nitrospira sp. CR1.1]|nr:hypothetical protein [Nitrospira sp. CR1.1]